jgi:putative hydrolase of the HAD superfamily
MAIKAIMVDVDGVLLVHPDAKGWSVDLERDLGLSGSKLQSFFFDLHWDDVIHGRASLRERLDPVLQEIAPHVSCDELIDYWFRNDAHVNQALLAELGSIRREGIAVHLATVQEHERARYLWEVLDFRSRFDGMHYAAELGCAKPDPLFYKRVELRTGFKPEDIFFIDDRPANVAAAHECGWGAALWKRDVALKSLISSMT